MKIKNPGVNPGILGEGTVIRTELRRWRVRRRKSGLDSASLVLEALNSIAARSSKQSIQRASLE